MSSNEKHIISLSNYEEWFILYMDDELNADEKQMVENFLLLHPDLQEELDLLLSTKLPADDLAFSGKEELQAEAMKLNTVDESLLLYIDNELSPAERKQIEEKIDSDNNYRLQYNVLQAARLDASEVIPYPDKKELYRHTERAVRFPIWMRMAAAAVVLLFGGYLFLANLGNEPVTPTDVVRSKKTAEPQKISPPANHDSLIVLPPQQDDVAKAAPNKKEERKAGKITPVPKIKELTPEPRLSVEQSMEAVAIQRVDAIRIDVAKLNAQPVTSLNKSLTNLPVTSVASASYNLSDNFDRAAVTIGDDNPRTPAKGFLRKVSRFIERRTGIGTVNADNELLVGVVVLKLN